MPNPQAGSTGAKSSKRSATGQKAKVRKETGRTEAGRKAAPATQEQATSAASSELRDFTIAFFRLFGAPVTLLDKRKQGPVQVSLTGDLAAHFGAEELGLAFQAIEPGSGHQLVAHGSRMFDRMLVWLERRSALTVRRLPTRHEGSEQLMRAIRPRNAGIAGLKLAEQQEPLFIFHWRMTYRADDKREELFTVAIDADGEPVTPGANGLPPIDLLLADSEPAPVQPIIHSLRRTPLAAAPDSAPEGAPEGGPEGAPDAGTDVAPAAETSPDPLAEPAPPSEVLPPDAALTGTAPTGTAPGESLPADNGPAAGTVPAAEATPAAEQWPTGNPDEAPVISPNGQRLPPMTQLVRLAERARRYAIYHADLRCVDHEADILPRLYKAVERLSNYYSQQIEELASGNDEKMATLQADLERKVAEEVENHRLRVLVELCGYAVVYVPTAGADLTLSDGRREARLRVRLNRYSGHMQRPACHACGNPVEFAVLCRNGHVACDDCLRQCGACHDVLCATCGVEECSTCGKALCATCGRTCWACGERACIEHVGRCPTCGDDVCNACRTPCAECGSFECRSHLRVDAVVRREDGAAPRLVCGRCAIRCPGCAQYSARLETCSLSGQRYCANCVVTCVGCGRIAGPGYHAFDPQGRPWCHACVKTCESCGAIASEQVACAHCGKGACPACALACSVCGQTFCGEHANVSAGCGHILCTEHAAVCAIGGEAVCTQCNAPCAICERHACSQHQTLCAWCGKHYCSECVEQGVDICRTCRTAVTGGEEIDLRSEPCAAESNVAMLAPIMRWQKAANRDLTVYYGVNRIMSLLLVVRLGRTGRYAVVSRRLDRSDLERARRTR